MPRTPSRIARRCFAAGFFLLSALAALGACGNDPNAPHLDEACVESVEVACQRACECGATNSPKKNCVLSVTVPGGGGEIVYDRFDTCKEARRRSYCLRDGAGVDFARCRDDVRAAACETSREGSQGVALPGSCLQ